MSQFLLLLHAPPFGLFRSVEEFSCFLPQVGEVRYSLVNPSRNIKQMVFFRNLVYLLSAHPLTNGFAERNV